MPDAYTAEIGGAPYQPNNYMHPAYWQPHEVGDHDAEMVSQQIPLKSERREAHDALQEYRDKTQKGGSYMPIATFNTGDEFDVAGQAPGTLLGFDTEYLYVGAGTEIDPQDYANLEPPVREPQYWPVTKIISARSQDCHYMQFASGTVVVQRDRRQPPRAVGAHLGSTLVDPHLGVYTGFVYHPSELVVGEVSHVEYEPRSIGAGFQVFSRINRIDVLVPGNVEAKRKFTLALGWSALRLGHNQA
ncbi:MAG TPA: hypothetical protein VGO07_01610 [Candidatus Saccharimonadales bacterium]|jgi:hypothetical protein|nr:hypothetical protein [Candidatus Saccharimonadales bacterium]